MSYYSIRNIWGLTYSCVVISNQCFIQNKFWKSNILQNCFGLKKNKTLISTVQKNPQTITISAGVTNAINLLPLIEPATADEYHNWRDAIVFCPIRRAWLNSIFQYSQNACRRETGESPDHKISLSKSMFLLKNPLNSWTTKSFCCIFAAAGKIKSSVYFHATFAEILLIRPKIWFMIQHKIEIHPSLTFSH